MNKEYYDSIGVLMIETWKKFAPNNFCLHLYLEDFELTNNDKRLIIEDWNEVSSLFEIWKNTRWSGNTRHQKFTLKALTQIALWRKLKTGKFLWLDADTIMLQPVPEDLFDRALGDFPLASWGEFSFESGTVFINLDHSDFNKIKEIYESIYIGEKGLPEGQKWFDGELLGWAVKEANVPYKNLWCYSTTKKTSTPLNSSWIGQYIYHYKAKRKNNLKEQLISENRLELANLLK